MPSPTIQEMLNEIEDKYDIPDNPRPPRKSINVNKSLKQATRCLFDANRPPKSAIKRFSSAYNEERLQAVKEIQSEILESSFSGSGLI